MERYDPVRLELWRLGELYGRSRAALARYLEQARLTREADARYLRAETLSHVDDMQEAFVWSTRAEGVARDELEYLVEAAPHEFDLPPFPRAVGPARDLRAPDPRKTQALRHAIVVFSLTPRLPESSVTAPLGRRSYRDIAPPRGPAALLDRLDELEETVTRVLESRAVDEPPLRRTYAFFETGHWLFMQHAAGSGRSPGPAPD